MKSTIRTLALGTALAALMAGSPALAQSLTVALQAEPSSIDPQFATTGQNQQIALNMFETLVTFGDDGGFVPSLATEWSVADDQVTWTFNLREGVTFHDGSAFNAQDVIFSLERVPSIENSPAPFAPRVAVIESVTAVDDYTIEIVTSRPAPTLLNDLGTIYIVSDEIGEGMASDQFGFGDAAIGTGPYQFVSYTPGDRVVIARNDDYWGEAVDFEQIDIRFISSDASRVASLQAGEVDMIDAVPPNDLDRLRALDGIEVIAVASARMVYMGFDQGGETTPMVTGTDANPFLDVRVREALAHAIDRQAIVSRIQFDSGEPAGQFAPAGIFGHDPDLLPTEYNPERARELLAEAGYADGFGLTVHGPNDRYINDGIVTQTVGQMWAQVGLNVAVETLPFNVYSGRATAREFSAFLFSFGITTGESGLGLRNVLATYDEERGWGANNRFRYSNPEFDETLAAAFAEFDDAERERLLQEATRIAMDDYAITPLYWEGNNWAVRDGLIFSPSPDGRSLMTNLSSAD
ncbi:ABC transporter substrate-binding protein [Pelagibacterium limicola]|uniref:ABC transporter substrate-binding protein n=1 Tax=Pelagibacterium limicola TaxID=2791022 RepID=UPI0018AFAE7F|nr:ABC transporter substrate-binding protein [Pelagibacterium limicola]